MTKGYLSPRQTAAAARAAKREEAAAIRLSFCTHTPHAWTRDNAMDAMLEASKIWPTYTFHPRAEGKKILIFTKDANRQPIGWLSVAP